MINSDAFLCLCHSISLCDKNSADFLYSSSRALDPSGVQPRPTFSAFHRPASSYRLASSSSFVSLFTYKYISLLTFFGPVLTLHGGRQRNVGLLLVMKKPKWHVAVELAWRRPLKSPQFHVRPWSFQTKDKLQQHDVRNGRTIWYSSAPPRAFHEILGKYTIVG